MTTSERSTFALTTPLYYVNGVPHMGSAYTTMAADAVARFQLLRGQDVLFITGTDEHGQKIERTAADRGVSPQEHCDEIVESFKALWKTLNIQYDRFSRTTSPKHEVIVKEFFQRVWDQGDIYLGQQTGWYCVGCEEFKEEKDLLEGHVCPLHSNQKTEWRDEQNYFFRLSKYQKPLEDFLAQNPDFIQPQIRRNEVLSFIENGLNDFSISRVNLDWGFPVPEDDNHTLYVWFDALLGYITALLDSDDEPTLENALKKWWPMNVHLIGKDILRFHAIYWPAMLMSAGLPLPDQVFGHGFLTKDGKKMGKSLGNTLDPVELVETYGADAVRFYFLSEIEFGRDGDFSEIRFIDKVNAGLAKSLGNLLQRTLKMAIKYFDGDISSLDLADIDPDNPVKKVAETTVQDCVAAYLDLNFSKACDIALDLARSANKYLDDQAPWTLYKQGKEAQVKEVIYCALETVRLSAFLLSPVIPEVSSNIYQQLGLSEEFTDNLVLRQQGNLFSSQSNWGVLSPEQTFGTPSPVFQQLQPPVVASS